MRGHALITQTQVRKTNVHVRLSLNIRRSRFLNEAGVPVHVFHVKPLDQRRANYGGALEARQESEGFVQLAPRVALLGSANTIVNFFVGGADGNVQLRRLLAQPRKFAWSGPVSYEKRGESLLVERAYEFPKRFVQRLLSSQAYGDMYRV